MKEKNEDVYMPTLSVFYGIIINMPNSKMKLISAWAEIHKEDLLANWKLLSEGNEIFRIDPLR